MNNFQIKVLESASEFAGMKRAVYPVLIFNDTEALLVDTAYPGQYEILKAEIEKHVELNKLKNIIITHHDIDHIGNAKKFKEEFGDAIKILSTKIEADYISGVKTPLKLAKLEKMKDSLDDATRGFYEMLNAGFPKLYVDIDETFDMDTTLNIITEIKVIPTPGHTLGHVCLYVPEKKALITGDTISLVDGKLEPVSDFYNYNPEEAKKSIESLKNYDIQKICCYHGGEYNGNLIIEDLYK